MVNYNRNGLIAAVNPVTLLKREKTPRFLRALVLEEKTIKDMHNSIVYR